MLIQRLDDEVHVWNRPGIIKQNGGVRGHGLSESLPPDYIPVYAANNGAAFGDSPTPGFQAPRPRRQGYGRWCVGGVCQRGERGFLRGGVATADGGSQRGSV
jgi:hypothetical protein